MSKAELDAGVEVTACVVGVHSSTIVWLSLVWF